MNRLLLVASCLAASTAFADSSAAQSQALFEQAKSLMAEGKFAEACAAFDSSHQLQPAITTMLNQGSCREKNHQFATAWGHFIEVERLTRNSSDEESLTFRRVASERAVKLRALLSTITIDVPESSRLDGLAIARGNTAVSVGEWNHPLPIDGGTYTISATAPGHESWQVTLSIGSELDVKQVKVPRLKEKVVEAPALVSTVDTPAPPPPSKLPYIIGGSAIVLGGLAIGVELWGQSNYSDAEHEFDDSRQRELWQSAKTKRYVAQGLGVAALAGAGVAVWRYLVDRRERRERNAIEVTPMAGSTTGVSIQGSW